MDETQEEPMELETTESNDRPESDRAAMKTEPQKTVSDEAKENTANEEDTPTTVEGNNVEPTENVSQPPKTSTENDPLTDDGTPTDQNPIATAEDNPPEQNPIATTEAATDKDPSAKESSEAEKVIDQDSTPVEEPHTATKQAEDEKDKQPAKPASAEERFKASMVLAGVGDALGYKNGAFEFCRNGTAINEEVERDFGGVLNIKVDERNWMVSDDTVMHIATAEALVSKWKDPDALYQELAKKYVECMHYMAGRAPGNTCMDSSYRLRPGRPNGYHISFNSRGGGCGAAMRAVPIGLFYNHPDQLKDLVAVAIESGRMTHNHPTGYLGALATALFVSYAFQKKPLVEWGIGLVQTLDIAWEYIEEQKRDVNENKSHWSYFKDRWMDYLATRGIQDGQSQPTFPEQYGPKERDAFYKSVSYSGWGGSSGHDAPMIAYDALLGCGDSWEELCKRGMFHGGDSDSTGIIAAACWGAMKGFEGVPQCNYNKLEFRKQLEKLSQQLYKKSKH